VADRSTRPDDRVPDDLVLVGRIARSHGLRGDVIVDPETDFVDERFASGSELLIRRATGLETVRIATVRFHKHRPIVRFDGIESVEQADALRDVDLWIRAADRAPLPAGEYYHDALIGCRVETTTGAAVGIVARIDGPRGGALLVVHRDGDPAREVLIPLAEAICPIVDPAAGRIVIDPPEGLLDVNE
jgi:16S rRNA processing protein RimM